MKFKNLKILSKTTLEISVGDSEFDKLEVVSNFNNDFDYYMNGIKKDFEKEQTEEILSFINENIDSNELDWVIANEDYDKIYSTLTFDEILKGYKNDVDIILEHLIKTMDVFIKHEKYEKCVLLKKLIKDFNEFKI